MPDDRHPTTDELADLAFGVLEPREAAAIKAHVAGCAACTQLSGQLLALPGLLAGTRYPPIPKGASMRIEAVLSIEARRRGTVVAGQIREGVVDVATGTDPFCHLCWAYRGKADWADRAVEFSADAVAAGQCVKLLGDASTADLRSDLAERIRSMPADRETDEGRAEACDLADYYRYDSDGIVDAYATITAHHVALDDALAAGYTGVRLVKDETAVARTETQRDETARMEFLGDREACSLPLGSVCCFDVDELGPDAVAELACMHPFINRGAAPFRLYAADDADFGLAGTIDEATAEGLFRTALGRTDLPAGAELIVDARRAEYMCDSALAELDAHAARIGRTALVRTSKSNSPSPTAVSALTRLTIDAGASP